MGRVRLTLPRLGETMEEARVVDWLVAPGAAFKRGDVLLEVETDKTVVEVPAMTDGVLITQLAASGDTVALDQPIAEIEVAGAGAEPVVAVTPVAEPLSIDTTAAPQAVPLAVVPDNRRAASPAARAAARRAGVVLDGVTGTGRRGRITASDVAGHAPTGRTALHDLGGDGPTIVLLHGLFDDSRGWRDMPRRLIEAGHAVLAVDLPGHGASTGIAHGLDSAADQIAATLPTGQLCLIGHSLGAAIAVRLALRLGDRISHLILSAPAGLGPRINADFTEGMLCAQTPAALARALALLDGGPMSATALEQELGRMQTLRMGQAALADATAADGFQQIDIAPDIARLTCPVTVLFGTGDRILDWRDVANLPPGAAIHLVRGAGHLPHLAAIDLVIRLADQSHALERRIASP